MLKSISFFLASFLLLAITWEILFPDWRFASRDLRVAGTVTMPFIFVALVGCLIALKYRSWQAIVPTCLFLAMIGGCFSWASLHPLDSHSEPIVVGEPTQLSNTRHEITQIAYNNKHNHWETNTAIVERKLIFRKVISQTQWQPSTYIPRTVSK